MKKLFIERSTRGKDTAVAKQYVNAVYSIFPTLQSVDNLPPPDYFGDGPRKIKSVLAVDWNSTQNRKRSNSQPEISKPTAPTLSNSSNSIQNSQPEQVPPYMQNATSAPAYDDTFNNNYSIYGAPSFYLNQPSFYPFASTDSAPSYPGSGASSESIYASQYPVSLRVSNDSMATNMGVYPDLGNFNADSYLPQDYKMTIGRKYDLSSIAKQFAAQQDLEKDDEEDDDDDKN